MSTVDHGILAPAWAATGAADLVDDDAVLTAMLAAEVALAEAQAELGVIPAGAAEAVRVAAVLANIDPVAVAAGVRETANPVVAFVEQLTAAVTAVDASAAEYVHRGSTSQDILDTALMLISRDAIAAIDADLAAAAEAAARLAAVHRDDLVMGRTLMQQALPTTFGLKAAVWLAGLDGARLRLAEVVATLPVQYGGAAGTLVASSGSGTGLTQPCRGTPCGCRSPISRARSGQRRACWRRSPSTSSSWRRPRSAR
jgi:3-carboxy-cis,cis-muconate cycloisomerase